MSGIPEEEVSTEMKRRLVLQKQGSNEYQNGFCDSVCWAERFRWDARETLPTPGERYLRHSGRYWEPVIAGKHGWMDGIDFEQLPFYRPDLPAPEDD